jgi:protein-S-isoprenylcysteine O-methyltransferase Ste14
LRVAGGVLIALGPAMLVGAFVRCVREGRGRTLPVAAANRLVVDGVHRHVRHPVCVGWSGSWPVRAACRGG